MSSRHRWLWALPAAVALAPAGLAQPRAVEVFGQIGVARAAGDEGSLGTGASYGAAVTVPIVSRWAVDVDVAAVRARRTFSYAPELRGRQTLISPSLVYRRGSERAYFFAGGGTGAELSDEGRFMMLLGKCGVVVSPTRRLLLRGDFLVGFSKVLPNVGVRFGIGYRF
jgi:hypothetical protein